MLWSQTLGMPSPFRPARQSWPRLENAEWAFLRAAPGGGAAGRSLIRGAHPMRSPTTAMKGPFSHLVTGHLYRVDLTGIDRPRKRSDRDLEIWVVLAPVGDRLTGYIYMLYRTRLARRG